MTIFLISIQLSGNVFRQSTNTMSNKILLNEDAIPLPPPSPLLSSQYEERRQLEEKVKQLEEENFILKSHFTENQLRKLFGKKVTKWRDDEITTAISLRVIMSMVHANILAE